ncbi:hypothetical protein COO60DRAFT_364180 [Scenedesmus sp. NREL 46B-D3]|nr:hypothetical protein COO60DRAFT_364180 [Scenedesmus sp. NREL 46B-D3]
MQLLLLLLSCTIIAPIAFASRQPWQLIAPDPLGNVRLLADCLYNKNDLGDDCIPAYCQPSVTVHQGDGVWLPRAPFAGTQWVTALHRELFQEFSAWSFNFLEIAATAGAAKGFTEVLGFFHWQANNTGSYHGLDPTDRQSADYGVMHLTADKQGKVTDVTIWRAGFMEEREVLLLAAEYQDTIGPIRDITQQPFWMPSQSLQLKMITHAHTLIEVLNQGDKFLDSLDDIAVDSVVLLDGMHIWGPAKAAGLTALKLWVADWLQQYELTVAITASAATPTSNKVFLCFKMLLTQGSSATQVNGCLIYVFNIQGFITHIVVYRNGTPKEMAEKFIGGSTMAGPDWHGPLPKEMPSWQLQRSAEGIR